jgi:hypothetical protein
MEVYNYKQGRLSVWVNTTIGNVNDDFLNDTLIAKLDAFMLEREVSEKELHYKPKRQGFWDYITGKEPKSFKVKVDIKAVLKNSTIQPSEIAHYNAEILTNDED